MFLLFVLLGQLVSLVLLDVSPALAQEIDFSIYPPLTEVIATPSSTVRVPLSLINYTKNKMTLTPRFRPFTSLETGEIAFRDDRALDPIRNSLSLEKSGQLIKDELVLRPNEIADLTLVIDIPNEATASDFYFTVIFQTKNTRSLTIPPGESYATSRVEAGIGSNILLTIYDPRKTSSPQLARIKNVSFPPLSLTLENQSAYFIKAKGTIGIKDVTGRQIKRIELPSQHILASETRELTLPISLISTDSLFGRYTAEIAISTSSEIGGEGKLFDTRTFYVLPKKTVSIALFSLSLIILLSLRFRRFHRTRVRF